MKLTPKQQEAIAICSDAKEILFYGGSRSGKTTIILLMIILRALNTPNSRHFLLRLYAASARKSLFEGSLPYVMKEISSNLWDGCEIHAQDMRIILPNKSEILIDGVEDKNKIEKFLCRESSTVFLDEASLDAVCSYNPTICRNY